MYLRQKGLWIAYGLLFVFHAVLLFSPPPIGEMVKGEIIARHRLARGGALPAQTFAGLTLKSFPERSGCWIPMALARPR